MRSHLHLFISRIAFICNVLFLYCLLVRHNKDYIGNVDVNSIVITLGWGAAFFLNIIILIWWLVFLILKKKFAIPNWLLVINSIVFLVQVAVLLF